MSGGAGQAIVPIAASLAGNMLAPGVGTALGSAFGTSVPAWLSSGLTGAAMGGIGSAIMGQNPLQGALMGGIGGGLASQMGIGDSMGSLFGGGLNPDQNMATAAIGQQAPNAASSASGPIDLPWSPINEGNPSFVGPMPYPSPSMVPTPSSSAGGGFWDSKLGQFIPYAGIGAAALLADNAMAPEQVGPPLRKEIKSGDVRPMEREYTDVDPLSYLTAGGNRSFFNQVNPQVRYYAKGGRAENSSSRRKYEEDAMQSRARMSGHAMEDSADFVTGRYMRDKRYPGNFNQYMMDEYGDVPLTREIKKVKKYANGGSSSASSMNIPEFGIGRRVKGRGDGMDDKIPAMLSDGEFVISAPVVSALGNGSNDAGARKLDRLQKQTLKRHYKGGQPKKSYGIGSYVH